MLQRRGGLDLHHEPLGAEHGGELRLQDLERDLPVVLEVVGEVHRRHPARAELPLDPVTVGEGRGEAGGEVAHGFGFRRSSSRKFSTTISSPIARPWLLTRLVTTNRWSPGTTSYVGW